VAFLSLAGTEITDSGVASLSTCKLLIRVNVWKTKVTRTRVKAFHDGRPNVRVVR
jgi:hypothetical protein